MDTGLVIYLEGIGSLEQSIYGYSLGTLLRCTGALYPSCTIENLYQKRNTTKRQERVLVENKKTLTSAYKLKEAQKELKDLKACKKSLTGKLFTAEKKIGTCKEKLLETLTIKTSTCR